MELIWWILLIVVGIVAIAGAFFQIGRDWQRTWSYNKHRPLELHERDLTALVGVLDLLITVRSSVDDQPAGFAAGVERAIGILGNQVILEAESPPPSMDCVVAVHGALQTFNDLDPHRTHEDWRPSKLLDLISHAIIVDVHFNG